VALNPTFCGSEVIEEIPDLSQSVSATSKLDLERVVTVGVDTFIATDEGFVESVEELDVDEDNHSIHFTLRRLY
jgi:hypothetical protein